FFVVAQTKPLRTVVDEEASGGERLRGRKRHLFPTPTLSPTPPSSVAQIHHRRANSRIRDFLVDSTLSYGSPLRFLPSSSPFRSQKGRRFDWVFAPVCVGGGRGDRR
ncbi:unnamed protein product, partial [Musa acuminata subsp. burmannicoides]